MVKEPLKVGKKNKQQGELGIRVGRHKMGTWTLIRMSASQGARLLNHCAVHLK